MSNRRYSKEFKDEAVKQVRERGYSVQEVARRAWPRLIKKKLHLDRVLQLD